MGSSVNSATAPGSFVTAVNNGLRLMEPQPQYFFARALMAGRLNMMAIDAGAKTVQQFVSMAGVGTNISPELDRLVRFADTFPDMILTIDQVGAEAGATVKMTRPVFSGGGYTLADRRKTPDKPTSTSGQSISSAEASIILQVLQGPYSTANSRVEPYGISEFDAKFKKSPISLASQVTQNLQYDYTNLMEYVVRDLFRSTANITYPDGISACSSLVVGGTNYFALEQFLRAKKSLKDRNIRPFPNGRYVCLVPSAFNIQMAQDPDWLNLSRNAGPGAGTNLLYGQIASLQDVDFFEVTTLKQYAAGVTVPNDATVVGTGVTVEEALMFGPAGVGCATGQAPEVRFSDDTDFGETAKVIWRSVQGFETLDSRFIQRVLAQST
jgi:hypothetical protein